MATVRELVPLLMVSDVVRSAAFYTERLGFHIAQSWEPEGRLRWCRIERDGAAVMLEQEDAPPASRGRGVVFYFICDDADGVHAELSSRGVQLKPVHVAFYGMRQVYVADPDGYELCFENPTAAA